MTLISTYNFSEELKTPPILLKIYKTLPDLKKGEIGEITEEEKKAALAEVNKIRKLHHLPKIEYETQYEKQMNEGALITAANGVLNHNPQKTAKFYSEEGGWGCFNGNLYLEKHTLLSFKKRNVKLSQLNMDNAIKTLNPKIATAEKIIDAFLLDERVISLGHRRWLLNPFFFKTSYGRVDGYSIQDNYHFVTGATLKVMNFYNNNVNNNLYNSKLPDFVAYPYENYPSTLFKRYWYFSFSAIADKKSFWKNKNVNFSSATINITDEFGNNIKIKNVQSNNLPNGLPNCIQWKALNIKLNTKYYVTISNVKVLNKIKSYKYWFNLNK